MKVFYYCQHVLGVGHFFRSLEIARALSGCEVVMVTGGPPVAAGPPSHVREIRLPPLRMDEDFHRLLAEEGSSLEDIKERRRSLLVEAYRAEGPDVLLIELFPFGRNAFRFELEPLLDAVGVGRTPRSRVVCSVRDILVEKPKQDRYEERVVHALDSWFDEVLVHSDPRFFRLEDTFGRAGQIPVPIRYTGFVAQKPVPGSGVAVRKEMGLGPGDRLIAASAGGGAVGSDLLLAAARAHRLLGRPGVRLLIHTGPFMPPAEVERIGEACGSGAEVRPFADDFPARLDAADLSISMAGYNTCMAVLGAGVFALLRPFARNREQGLRAAALARIGAAEVIEDQSPENLAAMMEGGLDRDTARCAEIDLDGAENTARLLTERGRS